MLPALLLLYVSGVCLTFLGCFPNLEVVSSVPEPILPQALESHPPLGMPGAPPPIGVPYVPASDEEAVEPSWKGWSLLAVGAVLFWTVVALIRFLARRRKS